MCAILGDAVELRLPSRPEYVVIARTLVTDIARRMALSASAVEDVQVAVSEACANVVRHAYAESGRSPHNIFVRCTASHGWLTIEVADNGCGLRNSAVPAYDANDEGGLGLILMCALMDHVSVDSAPKRGTTVRMTKNLDGRPSPSEARLQQEKIAVSSAL